MNKKEKQVLMIVLGVIAVVAALYLLVWVGASNNLGG